MPIQLNPYLMFNGSAEQAIRLYERVLGARIEALSRFGDVPDMNTPEALKDRVMHAQLHIGDGVLMVSDSMPDRPVPSESNIQVCLQLEDVDDMTRKFDALAEGGKVTLQPHDTFWGARFGMLTDAHGINWMFNCELKKG